METINLELGLADFGQIEKRMERVAKGGRATADAKAAMELEKGALERILAALDQGLPARSVAFSEDEQPLVDQLNLLTAKKVIYAANVNEEDLADGAASNAMVTRLSELAAKEGAQVVVVSAQVESELKELDAEERAEFLEALGVAQAQDGGLQSLVKATYATLGLSTYFTSGEKETRAWTIRAGMTAPQAAGVIHSDFERGFIRAETVAYADFVRSGGLAGAKDKGVLRSEGKDYVVAEGDVMLFRFNV